MCTLRDFKTPSSAKKYVALPVLLYVIIRNLSSRIDLHTHAGNASGNRVTLTFDLLTSFSQHGQLP